MAELVTNGTLLKCSCGTAPGALMILPMKMVMAGKMPAATVMDHIPIVNVPTFVMCTTPANPAVAAAMGAPSACIPVTPMQWVPGALSVRIASMQALDAGSKLSCMYGGMIEVTSPAQRNVTVA